MDNGFGFLLCNGGSSNEIAWRVLFYGILHTEISYDCLCFSKKSGNLDSLQPADGVLCWVAAVFSVFFFLICYILFFRMFKYQLCHIDYQSPVSCRVTLVLLWLYQPETGNSSYFGAFLVIKSAPWLSQGFLYWPIYLWLHKHF